MYPYKISWKSELACVLLLLVNIVASLYFYAHFPDQVITHWGFGGEANGFSGKAAGAFLIPVIALAIYLVLLVLPLLDPHHEQYRLFAEAYQAIKASILGLLTAVYLLTGFYNLGYAVPLRIVLPILVGIFFAIMGKYLGQVKRNWFVGVRTPWTLSSEAVWDKTNQLTGKLFMIFGVVLCLMPFLPLVAAIIIFVVSLVAIILGSVVYSYYMYRQEQKGNVTVILLIVVVILIAVVYFVNKPESSVPPVVPTATTTTSLPPETPAVSPTATQVYDGVYLTSPATTSVVMLPATINGYLINAHWSGPFEGQVGTVQLFTKNGQPASELAVLKTDENHGMSAPTTTDPVVFSAVVSLKTGVKAASTTDGYLLFKAEDAKGDGHAPSFKVNLQFQAE